MSNWIKKLMVMTAVPAAFGLAEHTSVLHKRPAPKVYKGESPKCKTCKYFKTERKCDSPMKMACEKYARRKKK